MQHAVCPASSSGWIRVANSQLRSSSATTFVPLTHLTLHDRSMSDFAHGLTLLLGAGLAFACVDRINALRRNRSVDQAAAAAAAGASCASSSTPSPVPPPLPFSIRFAVGPMVAQSDHALRMLTRAYGATVAYTPMLYSVHFDDEAYRTRVIDFDPISCPTAQHDRPLIVQFAANDPETLLRAVKHVEHMCDAIDINLGSVQDSHAMVTRLVWI
jgi:hypothetical protein